MRYIVLEDEGLLCATSTVRSYGERKYTIYDNIEEVKGYIRSLHYGINDMRYSTAHPRDVKVYELGELLEFDVTSKIVDKVIKETVIKVEVK